MRWLGTTGDIMGDVVYGAFVVFVLASLIFVAVMIERGKRRVAARMTPEEIADQAHSTQHGHLNAVMVCPHCQFKDAIRTKPIQVKKGISGAKATAAIFTAGVSLVATGLSRKEGLTQAWCGHCSNSWTF